jgi:hypothetical protein
MTVRTARNKRTRLANRRRLAAARPTEDRLFPLVIVQADGSYLTMPRQAEATRA